MDTNRVIAWGVLVVVCAAVVAAPVAGAEVGTRTAPNPCVGTVHDAPDRTTLVTIQGARGAEKTAAMLVSLRPDGSVRGLHNGSAHGKWWFYDVDPLANGNLLLSTTEPGVSVVEELSPTGTHVATRRFPNVLDSHDADLVDGELLVTDMSRDGNDRVFAYNLSAGERTWQYRFADHAAFPTSGGGPYGGDWTHNNDIEAIGDGLVMVSVRNFDTVVAIDRETKEIAWQLGSDDNREVLFEQHNPDYLETPTGRPTVLVADSRNDRVVEYTRTDDGWTLTWAVSGFAEPRDADRLPNGNTLVVDRRGDRLVEVTPTGEVVWEVYTPWQPYDAERLGTGDESTGPTMREHGTTGRYEATGGADFGPERKEACYAFLQGVTADRLLPQETPTPTAASTQTATQATDDGQTPAGLARGSGADPSAGWLLAGGLLATVVGLLLYGRRP
ncbi:aryl-sulfate sulfotransferase [Halosegnis sp.]|uniref:aryl-sulfate sulfotransferase n=1 Tax=Halosegnis sp. TaxID=2864959 RepID=UPI0035D3D9D2